MKWSKLSHIGLVRKNNEDNSCVFEDIPLLAVADGMGGHKAGEVASKLALDSLALYLRENHENLRAKPGQSLLQAFKYANSRVYEYAIEHGDDFRGMGTTVTAIIPQGADIHIAHVGDSRAYLVRGHEIKVLTDDHSLVNELLKSGGLTEEEAQNHPQRNILTRAIGTSQDVEVDIRTEPVIHGDIIVLCTDGLFNRVNVEEIKQMAGHEESLGERAKHLVERALERGGADNITVVLYQVEKL
ncbi:MAG: Stp1/IreP family PP2C-type Ser/Thr phosphatase [Thermincola sp.]|jgi:protein phosphatase|nr:Stp1/IreP family PP2C-type Ser/Thr phosphatase [Thermincola sp.]MDT3703995.1 Stp1/IreP family PP2C-type Ser/Thr phosphatase [Thermincola sp.]